MESVEESAPNLPSDFECVDLVAADWPQSREKMAYSKMANPGPAPDVEANPASDAEANPAPNAEANPTSEAYIYLSRIYDRIVT